MPSQSAEATREGRGARAKTFCPRRALRRLSLRALVAVVVAVVLVLADAPVGGRAGGGGAGGAAAGGAAGAPPPPLPPPSPLPFLFFFPVALGLGPPFSPRGLFWGDAFSSVVTARRFPVAVAREDHTAASSVLRPSDSPRAEEDLGTLLLEVPGASVTRRGGLGSFATLSLRGSNPDEVRIYVDGIPLNQAVGGAVDLSTLPLGDVERVEIYRGSTPISFGESALGGVVSISTRTPETTQVSARAGAGSFQTTFADVTAGGAVGRWRLYVGLHALRAIGDFPYAPAIIPGAAAAGDRASNDLMQLDGVARAVVTLGGRRELRVGFIGVWRDQGLPAKAMYPSMVARGATTRALGHIDYESRADLGASSRLRAALFASATRDEFWEPLRATHDVTRSVGVTVTPEKALGEWGRLAGLIEGRAEEFLPYNDADPTMRAGVSATREVAAVGSELDARVAPLDLDILPSARLEASRDVRTGRDSITAANLPAQQPMSRLFPVLRVGFVRTLPAGVSLRGNIGRYARIPSFLELYGYNLNVLGNPTLRPEQGVNADLGIVFNREGPAGSVLASATLFGARVDDLIAWQSYTYQTRAENVSRARVGGIETELRLRRRRLTLIAQATLTDARDEGEIQASHDQQIAYHPRTRGYARGEWRQPIIATPFTVCGYADLDGTAGNHSATSRYALLPARVLVGAGLAIEHARAGLRLSANAFNLADSRVYDFPDYPLPGRSVFVALGWSSTNQVPVPLARGRSMSAGPYTTKQEE